jgi:anti-anti-sigma factor
MELQITPLDHTSLSLSVIGDFDVQAIKEAQVCIDKLIADDNHPHITIDLEHVNFLDSSGIGAIVYFYKRLCENDRSLSIKNAHGQPLKMMELLRIGQAIPLNSITIQ